MKILHVINSLDPKHGGPSVCAPSLGAAQAALGHKVEFIFRVDPMAEGVVYKSLESIPGIENIILTGIPSNGVMERLFKMRSVRALVSRIAEYDIVHMHGVWDMVLLSAAFLAMRSGTSFVFTPHGMLDPWSLSQRGWRKKILLAMGVKTLLSASSFLHALNESEATLIKPLQLKCPVRLFPNGVFPSAFSDLPDEGMFYHLYPEMEGRRYILFLSRLHHKKGLDYVAGAYARFAENVKDVELVIAGPDAGVKAEFIQKIEALGLTSRVHVIGPLYGQRKYAALRDAACFLLPSRQEGFSMAIIEAMACGVPVVISENCHFPEVEQAGAGYVVKLGVDDISEALVKIVQHPVLAGEMGSAGQSLVFRNYTWERIAQRMLKCYCVSLGRKDCLGTESVK